ncbi:MAG: Gfo/Idh/MocA family oxidoreductase, partial [Anaerolineae bacterium]|nr:Gfo/Idh/MocA family oxidoreductase [Anaerolineae bacterium]
MLIRFAVIGLKHPHMLKLTEQLLAAGAEITGVFDDDPGLVADYSKRFPQAQVVETAAVIVEDESVQLVIAAPIPNERADLGIQVMQYGKDYLTDKPGFTTLEQLEAVKSVQAETQRRYHV